MITIDHVTALSRINRFNGWTRRPYSVLEHTVIGTEYALRTGHTLDEARAFLLHDMEESVFGDIVRPVKQRYVSDLYHHDVSKWNERLCGHLNFDVQHLYSDRIVTLDNDMLAAELHTVATVIDNDYPFDEIRHDLIARMIRNETCRGNRAIDAFQRLWSDLFRLAGPLR